MPLWGPQTTQGPARWERARKNAQEHPTSAGAKKYRWRCAVADDVVSRVPGDYAFTLFKETHTAMRREHLCSVWCATMRLQLNVADKRTTEEYVTALRTAISGQPGNAADGERAWGLSQLTLCSADSDVQCRVCAATIHPQAMRDHLALNELDLQVHVLTDRYVLVNGHFVPLSTVRVVELTLEQHHMLERYSTDELRAEYTVNCGYPLSEA